MSAATEALESPQGIRTVVVRPHQATDPTQISLQLDDLIIVLEQDSSGWFGGHRDGEEATGWFPGSCVRPLDPEPFLFPSTGRDGQQEPLETPAAAAAVPEAGSPESQPGTCAAGPRREHGDHHQAAGCAAQGAPRVGHGPEHQVLHVPTPQRSGQAGLPAASPPGKGPLLSAKGPAFDATVSRSPAELPAGEAAELRAMVAGLAAEAAELRARVAELAGETGALQQQAASEAARVAGLEAELRWEQEGRRRLEGQFEEQRAEVACLHGELRALRDKLDDGRRSAPGPEGARAVQGAPLRKPRAVSGRWKAGPWTSGARSG
ncbi:unnamed protein product [Prorocentrum cordatum]|uniref:SH3 domain-containing protein n=1 Tax=Prorocentrum cordatum TaxID=2364126 RepID=A0ABN9S5N2_9DINO|nr:unnamed protein product [Polarella glacialis]